MNKVRLVKKDLLEQMQSAPPQTPPLSATCHAARAIVDWAKSRQATQPPDPRKAFAALFIKDAAA